MVANLRLMFYDVAVDSALSGGNYSSAGISHIYSIVHGSDVFFIIITNMSKT